jgi:hypothetical protein
MIYDQLNKFVKKIISQLGSRASIKVKHLFIGEAFCLTLEINWPDGLKI